MNNYYELNDLSFLFAYLFWYRIECGIELSTVVSGFDRHVVSWSATNGSTTWSCASLAWTVWRWPWNVLTFPPTQSNGYSWRWPTTSSPSSSAWKCCWKSSPSASFTAKRPISHRAGTSWTAFLSAYPSSMSSCHFYLAEALASSASSG